MCGSVGRSSLVLFTVCVLARSSSSVTGYFRSRIQLERAHWAMYTYKKIWLWFISCRLPVLVPRVLSFRGGWCDLLRRLNFEFGKKENKIFEYGFDQVFTHEQFWFSTCREGQRPKSSNKRRKTNQGRGHETRAEQVIVFFAISGQFVARWLVLSFALGTVRFWCDRKLSMFLCWFPQCVARQRRRRSLRQSFAIRQTNNSTSAFSLLFSSFSSRSPYCVCIGSCAILHARPADVWRKKIIIIKRSIYWPHSVCEKFDKNNNNNFLISLSFFFCLLLLAIIILKCCVIFFFF